MLYYCAYSYTPGTSTQEVRQRFVQQHEAGTHHQNKWRGWYNLAGGGAGFVLIETDDPREITSILAPYMDLMSWDVRAIYENDYNASLAAFQQA
jgi:hypothetical protein